MDICQFHSHSEETGNQQLQNTNIIYLEDRNITSIYEETSNCELRFISHEEMNELLPPLGEYEELTTVKQLTTSCNNYCKLYKTFADTSINSPLENTDDQLFIEIVKEDIDANHNPDENKSILDSISFNIEDHEEKVVKIKITNNENDFSVKDSPKLVNWKPPEIVPKVQKKIKKLPKEKSPRKPIQLANYGDLITEAINSSPEKRMILTEIYQYIMEHVPFFKDIDKKGRNGWKNCVRHTLSVNKKFIRIKNTTKGRFSYWTVCEGGDFATQFAQYSWVSEIYKPEERKRKVSNGNKIKLEQTSRNGIKPSKQVQKSTHKTIDLKKSDKRYSSVSIRSNGNLKSTKFKIIENPKPLLIKTKLKKGNVKKNQNKIVRNERKSLQRTEPKKTKNNKKIIENKKTQRRKYVTKKSMSESVQKKQPTRILRVLPERLSRRAENKSEKIENDKVRRSGRKKCVRSWMS